MSLANRLISHAPRETSGSTSSNRFDYQLDWALCHLLELHGSTTDYVLVLDYHEDVLVLDSASDPQSVLCYQVKSKGTGNWTANQLIKRKQGKNGKLPSILGKLFQHTVDFGDAVVGLYFISNARLSARDASGDKTNDQTHVTYGELSEDERKAIASAICEECAEGEEQDLAKFAYERTTLAVAGHADQSLGLLAQFLEKIPEAESVPCPAFYRALKNELRRAQQHEERPSSFEDLCSVKATTRDKFQTMLARACSEPARDDYATDLANRLDAEKVDFRIVRETKRQTQRVVIERLDQTNTQLADTFSQVKAAIHETDLPSSLWGSIESVRTSTRLETAQRSFGVPYMRAMIGVCLYEHEELQGPHKNSQEEEA